MADISKIKTPDGTTYDLKDTTARSYINGHTINSDVPADAKFTDTTYDSKPATSGGTGLSLLTTG